MSESGEAGVTGNRRVYRMSAGDAAAPAILAAIFLVLMLVMLARGANALLVVPVLGTVSALSLLMSIATLISVTVVSAAGVQPSRLNSRVIPWEEIDSFVAIRRKGRISMWRVLLVPVENRRPFPLEGCDGPGWEARHNVDELNNILATIRARRTDGPTGESASLAGGPLRLVQPSQDPGDV